MSDRAELKGRVTLNSRSFLRGMIRVGRAVKRFGRQVAAGIGRGLANTAKLAVAFSALAAGALALMIRSTAKYGDELAKMSKRTGISAQELARWKIAAELSGTTISSVEKAVKKMAASIGDLDADLSTMVREFDKLGLVSKDFQNLETEEAFNLILERIAKLPSALGRAAVAQRIFGRAGTELLPMLTNGSKGIREMKAAADRLGLVLTDEQLKRAEEFQDRMLLIKGSIKGLVLAFISLEAVSKFIRTLTDKIIEFRKSANFKTLLKNIKSFVIGFISTVVRVVKAWRNLNLNTRTQLKNIILGITVFAVAFKLGFVAPILTGMSTALFATKTGGGLILATLVAVAGFKFGRALGKSLEFGRLLREITAFGKLLLKNYLGIYGAILEGAKVVGKNIIKLLTGRGTVQNPFVAILDEFNKVLKQTSGEFAKTIGVLDEEFGKAEPPKNLIELFKRASKEISKEFGKAQIKKDLEKLLDFAIPDSIKKLIESFKKMQKFKLPDLADPIDLDDVNDQAGELIEKMQKLKSVVAPFRGGIIGDIGAKEIISDEEAKRAERLGKTIGPSIFRIDPGKFRPPTREEAVFSPVQIEIEKGQKETNATLKDIDKGIDKVADGIRALTQGASGLGLSNFT